MSDHRVWQLHANVNVQGRDAALRVTMSLYDDNGDLTASRTWRRHVVPLDVDGLAWQALAGLQDLHKMLADACQEQPALEGVDEPLF